MIEVSNLVKFYGDKKALGGVSFKVEQGEILGFLGPKGEEPVPEAFQAGLDEIVELHATGVAVLPRGLFELLELIAKGDCLSSDDYCGMCHVCPLF